MPCRPNIFLISVKHRLQRKSGMVMPKLYLLSEFVNAILDGVDAIFEMRFAHVQLKLDKIID